MTARTAAARAHSAKVVRGMPAKAAVHCVHAVALFAAFMLGSALPSSAAEPAARAAPAEAPSHREMVRATIDEHILPLLTDFKDKAVVLAGVVPVHCGEGDSDDGLPGALAEAFEAAVVSWAAVAIDRIGPARKKDRATRISFWPDPRGIVRRQLRPKLAKRDPALTTESGVAEQSVALQGLPALELLLYTSGKNEGADARRYRCAAATAIAANVATQAKDMLAGWRGEDGWRHKMLSPGPENDLYRNEAEAAGEILKSYLAAAQIVRESMVIPWIAAVEKGRRYASLPFESSGLSKRYLTRSLESLELMHKTLGLTSYARVHARKAPEDEWIVSWLRNAFVSLQRNAAQAELPGSGTAREGPHLKALQRVKFYINGLRQIVGRKLAKAADIFLGFNELDGD